MIYIDCFYSILGLERVVCEVDLYLIEDILLSDRKGRAQEQEEVLRRAEQAKRDEEFARKLQEELDSAPSDPAPQPSETLSDHELARRLQVHFFLSSL